jgi:hypothetical protein
LAAPEAPADKPAVTFKPYGFARLDAAYATSRMTNAQGALWALSPSAAGVDEAEFVLYPRWSRFGVDIGIPSGKDAVKITGKFEIDFNNGGSESRALPRMLHVYGQVEAGDITLLAGQTSDLVAPLVYGGPETSIFWYGGNLGDRRPQLRVTYAPRFGSAQLVIAAAAAQSGAVGMEDEDADSVLDGVASARPAAQGLLELRYKLSEKGQPLRIGVSGHHGADRLRVAGEEEMFTAMAGVAHVELPISIVTLRAEGFVGENLRDLRGGVGQGVMVVAEKDAAGKVIGIQSAKSIPAKGGFVQLQVDPVAWYSLQLGTGVDNPRHVSEGGRGLNRTVHFSNAFKPWSAVTVGLAYDLYLTDYVGDALDDATAHRFASYTSVAF